VVLRRRPARALLVPDFETWLFSGLDLRDRSRPTPEPARAKVLVATERLPEALGGALREAWDEMPVGRRLEPLAASFPGHGVESLLTAPDQEPERHHGDEDHTTMITGEPSHDGLVMEDFQVRAGPLGVALPTGLVISATLDGDLVARCDVQPTLRVPSGAADPSAPAASTIAAEVADEHGSGVVPRLRSRGRGSRGSSASAH
jgi:hypothetical protein